MTRGAMTEDPKLFETIEKLQNAITELVLDLKGDGTVAALAKKIGMSRNRLADIFAAYEEQAGVAAGSSNRKPVSRAQSLYWDIVPLIKIAYALKITVSELIRAAEDVQEGFPPWFSLRISRDTPRHAQDELMHVFLEAVGCRTYGAPDPLNVKRERTPRLHCWVRPFTENDVSCLKSFAGNLTKCTEMKEIVKAYRTGKITSKDAYRILKKAVESVSEKNTIVFIYQNDIEAKRVRTRGDDAAAILKQLQNNENEIVFEINNEYLRLQKSGKSASRTHRTRK